MSDYGIQIKGTSPIIEKKPRPLSSQSPHLSVHAEGGRIGFKDGTNKKNGPVRPIDLPWPTPENPVPSKKKKKRK